MVHKIMTVTDLHFDLFKTYAEKEKRFMIHPENLLQTSKFRKTVVDWLTEVVTLYHQSSSSTEVLALAIMLYDKVLEKQNIRRSQLQLLGIIALRIASKYEIKYPMTLDECVYVCDDAYSKEDCFSMEPMILSVLDYNVTIPTSHTFLSIYFDIDNSTELIRKLSLYLLVKILAEYKILSYKPSIVACAIIYFSKKYFKNAPYWSQDLRLLTKYRVNDLQKCINDIKSIDSIDFSSLNTKLKLGDVEEISSNDTE